MRNSSEIDITIEGIYLRLGGTGEEDTIEIRRGDEGVPVGGSVTVPVNLNFGSGNTAEGIFLVGESITGLSGGSNVNKFWITSNGTKFFNFDQDIIIPKNRILTIYSRNSVAEIDGTLSFNYHPTIGAR